MITTLRFMTFHSTRSTQHSSCQCHIIHPLHQPVQKRRKIPKNIRQTNVKYSASRPPIATYFRVTFAVHYIAWPPSPIPKRFAIANLLPKHNKSHLKRWPLRSNKHIGRTTITTNYMVLLVRKTILNLFMDSLGWRNGRYID